MENKQSISNILHRKKICSLQESVFFRFPNIKVTYVDFDLPSELKRVNYTSYVELYLAGLTTPRIVYIDGVNEVKVVGGAIYLYCLLKFYRERSMLSGHYNPDLKDKTYEELPNFYKRKFLENEVSLTSIPEKGLGGFSERELVCIFNKCC